tara:strand:- start:901 stop:1089 length:189 start_codon:yes stop_codon:yes gene_type:complete
MIKIGDLVTMPTFETGLVGIVVDKEPAGDGFTKQQIGIQWIGGSGKVEWEPEGWLEVISESR